MASLGIQICRYTRSQSRVDLCRRLHTPAQTVRQTILEPAQESPCREIRLLAVAGDDPVEFIMEAHLGKAAENNLVLNYQDELDPLSHCNNYLRDVILLHRSLADQAAIDLHAIVIRQYYRPNKQTPRRLDHIERDPRALQQAANVQQGVIHGLLLIEELDIKVARITILGSQII